MSTKKVVPAPVSENVEQEDASTTTSKERVYSPEELLTIFDEIIFSGTYTEDVTIRGKLKLTFRSRTAEDASAISKDIDDSQFKLFSTLNERRALLQIAYSLVSYAGKDLSKVSIAERIAYVNKLPAALVASISDELVEFDRKVNLACQEGDLNF